MIKTSTKQERYRERLRAAGLRPAQIWVPDRRAPGFAEECRRRAKQINAAVQTENNTLDFVATATDCPNHETEFYD